jgi:hypothetical protein
MVGAEFETGDDIAPVKLIVRDQGL